MLAKGADTNYFFRGDRGYRGGPIGFALGSDADSSDIQDCAERESLGEHWNQQQPEILGGLYGKMDQ